MDVKGKRVLIVGAGVSGFAAAGLMREKGAFVRVTDSSFSQQIRYYAEELETRGIETETGGHTAEFCSKADMVISSPGVSPEALPLVMAGEKGIPVLGEMEAGYLFCKAPLIAVTGTNGKSTTTRLIGEILSSSGLHAVVCGNIGNPLSGELKNVTGNSVVVAETSSFQLETIKTFRPHVSVLLNVSEDHLVRHGGFEAYKATKFRIFENQNADDWAVIGSSLENDPRTASIKSRKIFFGSGRAFTRIIGNDLEFRTSRGDINVISSSDLAIKGRHNMENVACSLEVAAIMGVDLSEAVKAVKGFRGLEHRFETVDSSSGVDFIDDSKATNIDATRRALQSMDKKVVLISGGRDKGGDYSAAMDEVRQKVKAIVVLGESASRIVEVFAGHIPAFKAGDMYEAVRKAADIADKGEAVLLSPMCSSFDMFSDFSQRGVVFRDAVKDLVKGSENSNG